MAVGKKCMSGGSCVCFACRIGGNCKFRKSLDASHMPVNSIYVLKEKVC